MILNGNGHNSQLTFDWYQQNTTIDSFESKGKYLYVIVADKTNLLAQFKHKYMPEEIEGLKIKADRLEYHLSLNIEPEFSYQGYRLEDALKSYADYQFFKVGEGINPVERLRQLSIGCPYKLSLVYYAECLSNARKVEDLAHNYLDYYRWNNGNSEWFFTGLLQIVIQLYRLKDNGYIGSINVVDEPIG